MVFSTSSLRSPHTHSAPSTPIPSTATRIGLVDSNRTKADLMAYCCETSWGFEVVSSESNGLAGLKAAREKKPELLLVCLNFTDICSLEFVEGIRRSVPTAKVILLINNCSEYLIHLLGTCSYDGLIWEGETGMNDLGRIILGIKEGIRVVSPSVALCQNHLRSAADAFPKLLTKRQMEVLACISHCLSDEEIAARLACSTGTVLCHRRQLMRKLNIHSTPKLIRYGAEKGFDKVLLNVRPGIGSSFARIPRGW